MNSSSINELNLKKTNRLWNISHTTDLQNENHNNQTKEQHVINQLSTFQLHPTVNEQRKSFFSKLRKKKNTCSNEYEKQ